MERKNLGKVVGSICLALFLVSILALTPEPAAGQAKVEYKWRFGSAFTQKVRNDSIQMYCDLINKYSNGKIQIRFQAPFPSGSDPANSLNFK